MRKKNLWIYALSGCVSALIFSVFISFQLSFSQTAPGLVLPDPAKLTAVCHSGDGGYSVDLKWDPVPNQDSNSIQRIIDGGDINWLHQDFTSPFSVFSYTDENVSMGHVYTYLIKTSPFVESNRVSCDFRITDASDLPVVTTGSASSVAQSSATLSGTVNPNGALTDSWFEYGLSDSDLNKSTARSSVGSSNSTIALTANLTGLDSGKTYYFRLVGINKNGQKEGTTGSFKTADVIYPPAADTDNADSITHNSAILSGTVNPRGSDTIAWFEYRIGNTGTIYQSSAQSLGGNSSNISVSQNISGLDPDSIYYYRILAQSSGGKAEGKYNQFTTLNPPSAQAPTITIEPDSQSIQKGAQAAFRAYYDSDGSGPAARSEVTSNGTWTSGNTWIAESLGGGKFLGKNTGSAALTVSFSNKKSSATLLVLQSVVATSTPQPPQTPPGTPQPPQTPPATGSKPIVYTRSAQDVYKTYALLTGLADPNRSATKAWFEYGKNKSSLDQSTEPVEFSASKGIRSVSSKVTLALNNLYYFRVVAQNSYGTSRGEILEVASAGQPVLYVEPSALEVEIGQRASFRAYYDPDGSGSAKKEDITKKVNWVSSESMVIDYEKNGEFVAKNGGDAKVSAIWNQTGIVKSIYDLGNIKAYAGVTVLGDSSWLANKNVVPEITLGKSGNDTSTLSGDSGEGGSGGSRTVSDGSGENGSSSKSSSGKLFYSGWMWLMLILLLLIIIAIIVFILWKKNREEY